MKKIILTLILLILITGCTDKISETAKESKTEIISIDRQGMELVISPSTDQEIKGTITITMNRVPQGTKYIAFYIESRNSADARDGPPNLGFDDTENDGWILRIDTTVYDNGQQQILALAFADEPSAESEPLAAIQALVTINNPTVTYARNYPAVIKGNWEPSTNEMTKILNSEAEELKELGVNTVFIVLEYNLNKDGSYYLEDSEEFYISQLKKAKKAGFAVLVSPNFVGAAGHNYAEEGINIDLNRHLKNSEEVALKWAKIAEEYQVEYFAPQNEFNGPIRGNFAAG